MSKKIEQILKQPNPFTLPKEFQGVPQPRIQRPLSSVIRNDNAYVITKTGRDPNLQVKHRVYEDRHQKFRSQLNIQPEPDLHYGAELDPDVFFAEIGIVNPKFTLTKEMFPNNQRHSVQVMDYFDAKSKKRLDELKRRQEPIFPDDQKIRQKTFLTEFENVVKESPQRQQQFVAKGREDFLQELANVRADNLKERINNQENHAEEMFEMKKQYETAKQKRIDQQVLVQRKKQELCDLQCQEKAVQAQFIQHHEKLLQLQQMKYQYDDLVPLFETLQNTFPQMTPTNIIDRLKVLSNMDEAQYLQNQNIFKEIKNIEQENESLKLKALKDQFDQSEDTKFQIKELNNRIDDLQSQNQILNGDVTKAKELQQAYLQLCQDITMFWLRYGELYGAEMFLLLKPSVNNPIEVLYALDTVLSAAFPDAPKSQQNVKEIAGQTIHLFNKLFINNEHFQNLRGDVTGILQRAMQFAKSSQTQERELLIIRQRLEQQKEDIRNRILEKKAIGDKVSAEIRRLGEQAPMFDFHI